MRKSLLIRLMSEDLLPLIYLGVYLVSMLYLFIYTSLFIQFIWYFVSRWLDLIADMLSVIY